VTKWRPKNEYGFISTEDEIAYKGITGQDRIYVIKDDIICTSSEVGLNVGSKVRFKVYNATKGLGAAQVRNTDGSPIIYHGGDVTPIKKKPGTIKQKSSKSVVRKKEAESYPGRSKYKKNVTKRKDTTWRPLQYKPK